MSSALSSTKMAAAPARFSRALAQIRAATPLPSSPGFVSGAAWRAAAAAALQPRLFHHASARRANQQRADTSLPEFSLKDKVVVVSGGARGLGLVQAQALLEAGAIGRFLRCP